MQSKDWVILGFSIFTSLVSFVGALLWWFYREKSRLENKMLEMTISDLTEKIKSGKNEQEKIANDVCQYKDWIDRRLKDGTNSIGFIREKLEITKMEQSNLEKELFPKSRFEIYCKEHEGLHKEQSMIMQNLIKEISETRLAIDSFRKDMNERFQIIAKMLGQRIDISNAELYQGDK
jgi:hypothetical protein